MSAVVWRTVGLRWIVTLLFMAGFAGSFMGVDLTGSPLIWAVLLGMGLVASTFGIDLAAMRASDWRLGFRGGQKWRIVFTCVVLACAVAVGASWYWMFGLALLGIYLRPKGETYDTVNGTLEQWAKVAFAATGVMAGSMFYDTLSQGDVAAQLLWGVALGTMAFVSQMIVGSILMIGKGYTPQDRWYFACAHQNGLTAMILGVSTGAIALVVPAIVATHVLHGTCMVILRRRFASNAETQ